MFKINGHLETGRSLCSLSSGWGCLDYKSAKMVCDREEHSKRIISRHRKISEIVLVKMTITFSQPLSKFQARLVKPNDSPVDDDGVRGRLVAVAARLFLAAAAVKKREIRINHRKRERRKHCDSGRVFHFPSSSPP